jgi:hypothetical protein
MKKLILTIAIAGLMMSSCRKEKQCQCGEVQGIFTRATSQSINVVNFCTDNTKNFPVSRSEIIAIQNGDTYCNPDGNVW